MSVVIGVLALVAGLALIVIAAMGTQDQIFEALTQRTPPSGPTTSTPNSDGKKGQTIYPMPSFNPLNPLNPWST